MLTYGAAGLWRSGRASVRHQIAPVVGAETHDQHTVRVRAVEVGVVVAVRE